MHESKITTDMDHIQKPSSEDEDTLRRGNRFSYMMLSNQQLVCFSTLQELPFWPKSFAFIIISSATWDEPALLGDGVLKRIRYLKTGLVKTFLREYTKL